MFLINFPIPSLLPSLPEFLRSSCPFPVPHIYLSALIMDLYSEDCSSVVIPLERLCVFIH